MPHPQHALEVVRVASMEIGRVEFNGDAFSSLPAELLNKILDCLVSFESVTTYASTAARTEVCESQIVTRSSFWALSLTSRLLHRLATDYLYRNVLLRNEKELFLFFRALARRPDLCVVVRSFAWAGFLSVDHMGDHSNGTRTEQYSPVAADHWPPEHWPSNDDDSSIARRMGVEVGANAESWRVLGCILGMIPRAKALFLVSGSVPRDHLQPRCPEWQALSTIMDIDSLLYDPISGGPYQTATIHQNFITPSGRRFLRELEFIAIEPHPDTPPAYLGGVAHEVLLNSPKLRRIQMKGLVGFPSPHNKPSILPAFLSESMQEVVNFRGLFPHDGIPAIATAFPRLETLEAEYIDGAPRINSTDPFQTSKALATLSETLRILSLTTVLGRDWRIWDVPPLLPALNEMKALEHLTTEFIWLCGGQDLSLALKIADLLPYSLTSLRLIDYWGTSDMDLRPPLPNDWLPIEFLDQLLSQLYASCPGNLPHLSHIVLESPELLVSSIPSGGVPLRMTDAVAFSLKFRVLFASIGVQFSCSGLGNGGLRFQSSWATALCF